MSTLSGGLRTPAGEQEAGEPQQERQEGSGWLPTTV